VVAVEVLTLLLVVEEFLGLVVLLLVEMVVTICQVTVLAEQTALPTKVAEVVVGSPTEVLVS
jgi:hypothetical protein